MSADEVSKIYERLDAIEKRAGEAGDTDHRTMARDEARPLVQASEDRLDMKISTLTDRFWEIIASLRTLQNASLLAHAGLVLLLAAVFFIGARALGV